MMEEDERTFLCAWTRPRRYGTTTTPTSSRPPCTHAVRHQVVDTDTLQGLALRYNANMTEIRRMNKLWSTDSLHLKDTLVIPIYEPNEHSFSIVPGIIPSSSATGTSNGATTPVKSANENNRKSTNSSSSAAATESVGDILSRIDQTIKATASNVKKLEKQSTVDKALGEEENWENEEESGFFGSSDGNHSPKTRKSFSNRLGSSRRQKAGSTSSSRGVGGGGGLSQSYTNNNYSSSSPSSRISSATAQISATSSRLAATSSNSSTSPATGTTTSNSHSDVRTEGQKILASLEKLQKTSRTFYNL